MTRSSHSYKITLQHIADILSFQPNESQLRQQLHPTQTDWDTLVKIASDHLVLTTVYCRIKQKQLLNYLPQDLETYLEELTEVNRNRNLTLLTEIKVISNHLKDANIDHVFLKGSALLAGNFYEDLGERMIGDIDILVAPEQLDKAFQLIVSMGYSKSIEFNYENSDYRHLSRQIADDKLAAVELHKSILNSKYDHLTGIYSILDRKKMVNGMAIPATNDLIETIILGHQINNQGYYYNTLHFKYAYDCLVLQLDTNQSLLGIFSQEKHASKFLGLMNMHFPEVTVYNKTLSVKRHRFFYRLSLHSKLFRTTSFRVKRFVRSITSRLNLLVVNSHYRKYILTKKVLKHP